MITCLSPAFCRFDDGRSCVKDKTHILVEADKGFFFKHYILLSYQAFDKPVASGQFQLLYIPPLEASLYAYILSWLITTTIL